MEIQMKFKNTLLTMAIGLSIITLPITAYAASSSSRSSSSYSSSSRSSYSSSSSKSSYSSSPTKTSSSSISAPSKPSSTVTYKPVSTSTLTKTPYVTKQPVKVESVKPISSTVAPDKKADPVKPLLVTNKPVSSYSELKKKKYENNRNDSNFLSWVLLAWILSDSNKSSATTVTKEVVVDCKQWLKENVPHKATDSKLTDKEFKQIKEYCEKAGAK